jgi:tetratricopeptide (TPR) repeat protein
MRTERAEVPIYWGDGGEYGPFKEQQTGEWAGWPDFGEVMRYFRKKAKLEPMEFAAIYGRETKPNGAPITGRQVSRMELENEVPTDMNRRKLIARLLNIPPMLFGLAVLEDVRLQPHTQVVGASLATGNTTLPKVTADTTKYQRNIRTFLTLHYTSQVQSALDQINADIRDLESLVSQTRGDLLYHIREILFSYHLLAAKVVVDQRNFSLSHYYANHAVRVAKATDDIDLIATALYTRGRTYIAWGRCGKLERGVFQVQVDKINKAIRDFEDAKKASENTDRSLHPQLVGLIDMYLSRAYAIRNLSLGQEAPALVITLLDNAEEKADKESIEDPYERHLVTGSLKGFIKGEYHNNRAMSLATIGMSGAALKEIETLEGLHQGGIGKQFTRSQIWLDIVAADAYIGLEQFEEATKRAKRALVGCRDINSVDNLVCLVDIHGRLLRSSYKTEPDVSELGDMVRETLTARIEQ